MSIDQEAGKTARLNPSNGFAATRSEAEIGEIDSPATTRTWAQEIAHMLSSTRFTFNFAPVVDVNVNPFESRDRQAWP